MAAPKLATCDRVLVVEGYDDLLFYAEVLESVGKLAGVYIQQMGGKGNLTGRAREDDLVLKLETFLTPALLAEKRAIGIIVDGDASAAGTAASLEARLTKVAGHAVKSGEWTASRPGVASIGLFVVSGSDGEGELESLVWESWSNVPANESARDCVEGFLACMTAAGHVAHSRDKARIGAWLAVKNDEDPRLGPGARARLFDFTRPELADLLRFLKGF